MPEYLTLFYIWLIGAVFMAFIVGLFDTNVNSNSKFVILAWPLSFPVFVGALIRGCFE